MLVVQDHVDIFSLVDVKGVGNQILPPLVAPRVEMRNSGCSRILAPFEQVDPVNYSVHGLNVCRPLLHGSSKLPHEPLRRQDMLQLLEIARCTREQLIDVFVRVANQEAPTAGVVAV